jgi:hypothetical protein
MGHLRAVAIILTLLTLPGTPIGSTAWGQQGQPGQDELWEVTFKADMAGMPMAMPAQTQQICRPKGTGKDEELVPKERDCRVTDIKRSGNRMTFTMICEGKDKLTGTGDIVSDRDRYQGTMRMQGTMDGSPITMTQTFSGKRLGNCTYEDPKKKHDAMMAQQCEQALSQMQTAMFTMEQSPCKNQKPEFCSRVSRLAQEMRTPAGYKATVQKRGDWATMAGACNLDSNAITQEACAGSLRAKDYAFTVQYCEADAQALAKQHCEGRSYTAAMSSEYAPICQRYASRPAGRSDTAQPRGSATPPAQPGAPAPQPEVKKDVTDAVKEGADAIRKFLRW